MLSLPLMAFLVPTCLSCSTHCLNSIPTFHASADPSLQTLAVVGLENGEADRSQRLVA